MPGSRSSKEKVYPTYQPYPVSRDAERELYRSSGAEDAEAVHPPSPEPDSADDFTDLIGDPMPADLYPAKPIASNDKPGLRPLRLLQSLFADRVDLLQAALRELQDAKHDRQRLTEAALEDIDLHIGQCDRELSTLKGVLNDFDRRKHLHRQLLELKRQHRQEAVMSWRDLLSLKRDIRALKREIDSLGRVASSAENREAPT